MCRQEKRCLFSHAMIGTNDVEKAKAFYDKVLGALGISPGTCVNQAMATSRHGLKQIGSLRLRRTKVGPKFARWKPFPVTRCGSPSDSNERPVPEPTPDTEAPIVTFPAIPTGSIFMASSEPGTNGRGSA